LLKIVNLGVIWGQKLVWEYFVVTLEVKSGQNTTESLGVIWKQSGSNLGVKYVWEYFLGSLGVKFGVYTLIFLCW